EAAIQSAITQFENGQFRSLRAAAEAFDVPYRTTCAQFNGRPSRQQTHDLERALTPEQEQALKKHLLSIASWGFP
ncbi:hypothetical protein P154DRAFT_407839, partial [Amniculicola lignicola CBS 123094]